MTGCDAFADGEVIRTHEKRSPKTEKAAVERRKASALRQGRSRASPGAAHCKMRLSALRSPHGGAIRMKANPAPFKQHGRRSVGYAGCLKIETVFERGRAGSDIPALDLFGQRLDQVGNALEMRMHGERAAEGVERVLVVAELLQDHAQARQRAEMAWLPRQHLVDVGQRSAEILLLVEDRGAPIPGFDVIRPDVDDG